MLVEIKLFKRTGTYEKDGKEKQFINFYIGVNDKLIPIEVKYFANPQFDNRDPGYQGRVAALDVVAELLPEAPAKEKPQSVNPRNVVCPKCGKTMRVDDQDGTVYYIVCDDCGIGAKLDTKVGELSFTDSEGNQIS